MDGWMEKRIEIGEWRTKRERKETREKERSRETIVNDGRLKCPLGPEAGSRGQPGLDWQMIREICIRCEVFACQFGWKSRAYAYPAICSLSVLPWTKTEEIKMYSLSLSLSCWPLPVCRICPSILASLSLCPLSLFAELFQENAPIEKWNLSLGIRGIWIDSFEDIKIVGL